MRLSVLDLVSIASQEDTILVLPTLSHAVNEWNMYQTAFSERHGSKNCVFTITAVVMHNTNTLLRLWVPYEPTVEQPMQDPSQRRRFDRLVSPYYSKRQLRRMW